MFDRRQILALLGTSGIGTVLFRRTLAGIAQEQSAIDAETLKSAEWISGIELTDAERTAVLETVERNAMSNRMIRSVDMTADIGPAIHFQPLSKQHPVQTVTRTAAVSEPVDEELPASKELIAFLPVHRLAGLIRTKKISSVELTQLYLARLNKYGPMLRCVVTLTEKLALEQALRADNEIAAGNYRGPLHGIPWGAKDLISVPGYPTSWGIPHLKDQMLDQYATVAKRLEESGAVLVAKLALGALAMGDQWFGGMCRNPWNPIQGSSGSSAGSAAATVAGLVGFSLGSETLGSILSPCKRCGSTGLPPTFGRVSRYGCMPLSWSMDKIGPICRSIEDCALVFGAIHGADGHDMTANNFPFNWPPKIEFAGMKIGVANIRPEIRKQNEKQSEKQNGAQDGEDTEQRNGSDRSAEKKTKAKIPHGQEILKQLGCELIELELPNDLPLAAMTSIIDIEGASAFEPMLRDGHVEGWNSWPESLRAATFISGVDYLRYQRARTKLMHRFEAAIADVDALFNMQDLLHTNFTGHPSVVLPHHYRDRRNGGRSVSSSVLTGHLNDDQRLLGLAHAFQQQLDAHLAHPPLDDWLKKFEAGELDEDGPDDSE